MIFVSLVIQATGQSIAGTSLLCAGERTVAAVQRLLADGTRIDSTGDACTTLEPSPRGVTLLMSVAADGDLELIRFLLDNGAAINAMNTWQQTPLTYAVSYQKIEAVRLLIEKGADVNVRGESGSTLLMKAASNGNLPIMEQLLSNGADVLAKDQNGVTALMCAAAEKQLEAMNLLVERGANPKARDKNGRRAKIYLKKGYPREYIIWKL